MKYQTENKSLIEEKLIDKTLFFLSINPLLSVKVHNQMQQENSFKSLLIIHQN